MNLPIFNRAIGYDVDDDGKNGSRLGVVQALTVLRQIR